VSPQDRRRCAARSASTRGREAYARVDADIPVGEFRGERMAQAVNECSLRPFAIGTSLLNARKIRYCSVSQVMRSPSSQTNKRAMGEKNQGVVIGRGQSSTCVPKPSDPAFTVLVGNSEKFTAEGHSTIPVTFTPYL
jgi:hypothetical protein